MRTRIRLVLLAVVACGAPVCASAGIVEEAWRSPFGTPRGLSVNPVDGSCWAAAGSRVLHIGSDGTVLSQTTDLSSVKSVSVNPRDGSCWAADWARRQVVHLGPDGSEWWRGGQFGDWGPRAVSVSPSDGACWVADTLGRGVIRLASTGEETVAGVRVGLPPTVTADPQDGSCWTLDYSDGKLVHLAADGSELSRTGGLQDYYLESLSVDPRDGSLWIPDRKEVVHVARDGSELWRGGEFEWASSVSADPRDGSCWVADAGIWDAAMGVWQGSCVVHLAADGRELWRGGAVESAVLVCASGVDGSCWVADGSTNEIIHVSARGDELWRSEQGFVLPSGVAAAGDCWIGYGWGRNGAVARLSSDGAVLWRGGLFWRPGAIALNGWDGSAWVADAGDWASAGTRVALGRVVRLTSDGAMAWQGSNLRTPNSVAVSRKDGSAWIADSEADQVIHVDALGRELWRVDVPAYAVAADLGDGSCWVAGYAEVEHLAPDGSELWRGGGFDNPKAVGVDPQDGSCWVADAGHGRVVLLSADGAERWESKEIGWADALAVDQVSGLCWVGSNSGEVRVFGRDGTEVWRQAGFHHVTGLSVDVDGSCWITDQENGEVTRLVTPQHRLYGDVAYDSWARDSIYACAGAGVSWGYEDWLYHPDRPVGRDQMAAYVSRALAGGDWRVPTAPATASFSDVPTDYWAFRYVEYAKARDIVTGYSDGTYQPTRPIDRGQMAVYMARAIVQPTGERGLSGYTPPTTPSFPDVGTDFWAYKHVEYVRSESIVGGYPDGTYRPDAVVTRDQMAVYVQRAFALPM